MLPRVSMAGYARVSTDHQSLDAQRDALTRWPRLAANGSSLTSCPGCASRAAGVRASRGHRGGGGPGPPRPVAVRGDPYRGDADGGRRAAAVAAGGDRLLHPGRLRARADARAGGGGPSGRPTARSAHRPAAEALRSLGPPGPRPAPGRGVDLRAGAQLRRFARHRLPRPATGPGRGGNPSRR